MTTLALIKEAIGALKDRTGSSTIAINKWIESEKKVGSFAACFGLVLQRVFRCGVVFLQIPLFGQNIDSHWPLNSANLAFKLRTHFNHYHMYRMRCRRVRLVISETRCALQK